MIDKIEVKFDYLKQKNYSNESILNGILHHTYLNSKIMYDPNDPSSYISPINPALFKDVPKISGYNIEAACNWLQSHAHAGTQGNCAKYVRSAIDIGFETNPNNNTSYTGKNGRPSWAWRYMYFLPKIGFNFIGESSNNYIFKDGQQYVPKVGDIAVYQHNGNSKLPGHICMWTGVQWCSDFRQNNMIVYQRTPFACIYRFWSMI